MVHEGLFSYHGLKRPFVTFLAVVLCSVLAKGSRLLCLWTSAQGGAAATGSTGSRKRIPTERIVLQVGVVSRHFLAKCRA